MSNVLPVKIEELKSVLEPEQISSNPQDLLQYGNDWLKQWSGEASVVLFPKNTKDVTSIVCWAKKHKMSLIPSGGRTGLSGGATALQKEAVVSFDKMNQILDFNPWEQTIYVEAGCVTQTLQEFAKTKGLYFPISFAAEGSSQIGGNIATNAGGVHVIRYGMMRNRVLGLEVVTGLGEILHLGKGLIKNALGYNLKELFIGSEGTLGFITKAILALTSLPDKPQVFLMGLEKSNHMLDLLKGFKQKIQPLAFEFFTDKAVECVLSHNTTDFPLSCRCPFYILMEIEERDKESSLQIFESLFEKELVKDGVLSQNTEQAKKLWNFRENISEAISSLSPYKNDICVKISRITDFLQDLDKLLKTHYPDFQTLVFGHLGDGNLHINILKPDTWERKKFVLHCENLNQHLFSLVKQYQGAISAEHGVGLLKKPYLQYSCSKEEIHFMKGIKKVFDPHNILNPGKIFNLNQE